MSPPTQATVTSATSSLTNKKRPFRRLKQFRCDGFGECDMVFSRSEHLARHIRKHTGEKPFRCEFLGCTKQFSRFDNMRQHAQTHQRHKNKSRLPSDDESSQEQRQQQQQQQRHQQQQQPQSDQTASQTLSAIHPGFVTNGCNNSASTSKSEKSNSSENGLVSPISMSGTFDDKKQQLQQDQLHLLTQDELDALEALNQFRQSPQATTS